MKCFISANKTDEEFASYGNKAFVDLRLLTDWACAGSVLLPTGELTATTLGVYCYLAGS